MESGASRIPLQDFFGSQFVRNLYALGLGYSAACGLLLLRTVATPPAQPPAPVTPSHGTAVQWFEQAKPWCNALEVTSHLRADPPPEGRDGSGYEAGCLALAGRIDQARSVLAALPARDRGYGAWIVFNLVHPVADAGDDRSAGPMMELVLEFWPDNYMALYHAGMSEYALEQPALARTHLERFLQLYATPDGWRRNATTVLDRLGGS